MEPNCVSGISPKLFYSSNWPRDVVCAPCSRRRWGQSQAQTSDLSARLPRGPCPLQPQHAGLALSMFVGISPRISICLSTKLWNQNIHFFKKREQNHLLCAYVTTLALSAHILIFSCVHLFCIFTYFSYFYIFIVPFNNPIIYLAIEYSGCLPFDCLLLPYIVSIFVHIAFL